MPGYSQLKKLSETVLKLGNEIKLRAERGERAIPVLIPDTIEDIDDSQDFVLGMPEKPKPPEPEEPETPPEEEAAAATSDVSVDDLLSGISAGGDAPDLSAFGDDSSSSSSKSKSKGKGKGKAAKPEPQPEPEPEPPPKPKGISGSGYSGFGFDDDGVLESSPSDEKKPDIGALMGGPGKPAAAASKPFEGATGIPELDAILNPNKGKEESAASNIPDLDSILNPPKAAAAPTPAEPVQEPEPIEEIPSEPIPSAPEPESVAAQEIDFGDLDDLQVEDYAAPEKSAEEQTDASALFGDDVEDFEMPSSVEKPKKKDFKPLPPEEDNAILKPDLFTDDSTATKDNPPYYATEPFGEPSGQAAPAKKQSVADETPAVDETPADAGDVGAASDLGGMDFDLDDIPALDEMPLEEAPAADEPAADSTDAAAMDFGADLGGMDFDLPDIPAEEPSAVEETPAEEAPAEEAPADIESPAADAASDDLAAGFDDPFAQADADFSGGGAIDLNMDLPEEISEVPAEVSALDNGGPIEEPAAEEAAPETPAEETPADAMDAGAMDFEMPDFSDMGGEESPAAEAPAEEASFDEPPAQETPAEEVPMGETPSEEAPAGGDMSFDLPDMDLGGAEGGQEISADAVEAPAGDADIFNTDGLDLGSFDMPDSFGGDESAPQEDGALPGESMGGTDEATASALGDFNIQDTDSQLSKAGDDFALEGAGDDFSIPGFSEEGADPYANEGKKGGVDQVDFSGAVTGDGKQRTSLTEEEYAKFKKNLRDYPLNVRIAVEDMIAKNEFTDEVVFEVIEKILKKVTARQLANHLEKLLDISLPVPRDYERRSAEEYEAYKASFAYQLKSRILPAIIIGIFAAMILFCVGFLGHRFVFKPLMAEKLYKEGYVLIQHDEFPLSKDKFDEALKYKSKKKWFFKYARAYREKKQYDLSELFYKNILKRFNHDKQAGLEYAQMEVEDLANYELAEEILKREVLDNHVNDADGILALGDTYLEWATEKDPAKFEDAFQTYSKLQQLYGSKNPNLYQSRFLRYNIRTDQLRNVLELKEFFYGQGEKSLGAADWTELSGYLMDKQYGELPLDQEFLRAKIEDVRDMILYAVKAAPEDPIANYNLSRYLVKVGDHNKAMQSLKHTETLFDKATNLRKKSIYKQLDNYRLLGEEYLYDREYILAREEFTKGLNLFEKKNRTSNFESDKNVGVMYYDMGNLEYFISGDLDAARANYQNSIDNKYDTPSIRYRVGYIDYSNEDYQNALNNFIKASQQLPEDSHTLLALGNTLSIKDDNYAAQGYYKRLLEHLDLVREKFGIVSPQTDERAGDMVEIYMKAANNLGVSLFRIARQSGSSSKNAASLVNFQDSIRYYDAMTRNQETMVRLPGSNLAEMNLRYATNPFPKFEPEIYTDIPRVLDGEKGLEQ